MIPAYTRKTGLAAAILCCAALGFSTPSYAEKGGGNHGHENGQQQMFTSGGGDRMTIVIDTGDRGRIRDYLASDYRSHCPPGLAKKHNGCMPPGLAKKYRIGEPLPEDTVLFPVPRELGDLLGPAPRGYQYVQVDKDVLLIGEASKKVIDAVTLLSALGE